MEKMTRNVMSVSKIPTDEELEEGEKKNKLLERKVRNKRYKIKGARRVNEVLVEKKRG